MLKACELDQTLTLPPIGTRVRIVDDGPKGTVTGFGTNVRAGTMPVATAELVPVVIVALDMGFYVDDRETCWVYSITVHPDNIERIPD